MSVITTESGLSLWWGDEGRGEPLVLIQGLGYTGDMWFRSLPALSARYRTIRFDHRGVGRSSVPELPWSMADLADDTAAVLAAADVDQAHVYGFSMGGLVAQELAVRHPSRVRSLVLGATHPGGRDAVRMDPGAATMLMDRSPRSARETAEASVPFLYAESTSRDDIDADLAVRLRYPLRASAYWGQLDAMRHHEGMLSRLRGIAVPTLVLHGTADRLVHPDNARVLAAAVPGATLQWLDGAGHLFWTDQPERSSQIICDFLAAVEQASAGAAPPWRSAGTGELGG